MALKSQKISKRGRPPNAGETTKLEFTVPAGLYNFLALHAKRAVIGATPTEVARYLLITYATKLMDEKFLDVGLPPATDSKLE
jgi:hypothetical protein